MVATALQHRSANPQSVQERAEVDDRQSLWLAVGDWAEPNADLPAWWTPARDQELRRYWKREGLLASALYNMQAILSTVGWDIEGEDDLVSQVRVPLDQADFGAGFMTTVKKLAEDWLTQDNGMFMEIIGPGDPTGPLTGMPTGIAHLDAGRCWRSADPEYPVWYFNEKTIKWHKLHWTRVAFTASNPSAQESARGIGYCFMSRVAALARMMKDTIRYKQEKISGRQTRGLIMVSGAPQSAVKLAVEEAEAVADNAGQMKFSAMPIIASPSAGAEVKASLLEMAGIPDGFDWEDEVTIYMFILALAAGIDARELWPATSSGATKADAEVQHRKGMRKGIGDFLSTLAFILNQRFMPEGATFKFSPKDSEEDQAQADLEKTRVDTIVSLFEQKIITVKGALTYLVNADVLPEEYLTDLSLAPFDQPIEPPELAIDEEADDPAKGSGSKPTSQDEDEVSSGKEGGGVPGFFRTVAKHLAAAFGRKNIVSFRIRIQAIFREYYKGKIATIFNFSDLMLSAITKGYREAWLEGAKDGGIVSLDELTDAEMAALQGMINEDFQYVLGVAQAIAALPRLNETAELSSLYDRAELWVNRYNAVKSKASAMAAANKKKKFALGATKKHCESCSGLAGRVYRNSVWEANGALPPSRRCKCKGYLCLCKLVDTTDRITPGRFPKSLLTETV